MFFISENSLISIMASKVLLALLLVAVAAALVFVFMPKNDLSSDEALAKISAVWNAKGIDVEESPLLGLENSAALQSIDLDKANAEFVRLKGELSAKNFPEKEAVLRLIDLQILQASLAKKYSTYVDASNRLNELLMDPNMEDPCPNLALFEDEKAKSTEFRAAFDAAAKTTRQFIADYPAIAKKFNLFDLGEPLAEDGTAVDEAIASCRQV